MPEPMPISDAEALEPIEGRCNRPVQECSLCEWRGQNYVGQPCKRCGADAVIERPCRNHVPDHRPCWKHGSGNQVTRAVQARELARLEAAGKLGRLLADSGITDTLTAYEVLGRRLVFAEAMTRALESLVAELDPDGTSGAGRLVDGDRPHVLEQMLRHWQSEAARTAKMAADLDIDQARLRLEHAEVDELAGVVTRAVAAAGLGDAATEQVLAEIAAELRRVGDG